MERHSFRIVWANRLKLCGNCVFLQKFHTRKLGEITVFYAVILTGIFFFFQNNHSIKHIRKYAFVVHANVEDIHQNQCSLKWAISQNDVERPACYVQHVVIHVLGDRKTNLIQILHASLSENDMLKINKKFVE